LDGDIRCAGAGEVVDGIFGKLPPAGAQEGESEGEGCRGGGLVNHGIRRLQGDFLAFLDA
jgi:hypothetical protein